MEEILASIRRIIADDEVLPAPRRPLEDSERSTARIAYTTPALHWRDAPVAEPRDEAGVGAEILRPLRLAARDGEPAAPAACPEPDAEPEADVGLRYTTDADADEALAAADPGPPLMSPDAASSIAAHFETLATTMMLNDSGILREYAQEMLRPMLKQWLDDNLPVIVERLVRAEIERVARGGRR